MEDRCGDPRAVLGLPLDATRGQARRAFRRLAKQTHPDAGGDPAAFRAVAGAWADLAPVLPADPEPPSGGPFPAAADGGWRRSLYARSLHRPVPGRVVWSEPRLGAVPRGTRRPSPPGRDFAAVLREEVTRLAS